MTLRADTSPAIFPARLRYLSDFMTTGGGNVGCLTPKVNSSSI
jgi:hypothetical protein